MPSLNDKQTSFLKASGYNENPMKRGLWSKGTAGKLRFLDFRGGTRAYRQEDGELVNDSNKILSQVKAMVEGQTTLEMV